MQGLTSNLKGTNEKTQQRTYSMSHKYGITGSTEISAQLLEINVQYVHELVQLAADCDIHTERSLPHVYLQSVSALITVTYRKRELYLQWFHTYGTSVEFSVGTTLK
jgi:hypothetical protein